MKSVGLLIFYFCFLSYSSSGHAALGKHIQHDSSMGAGLEIKNALPAEAQDAFLGYVFPLLSPHDLLQVAIASKQLYLWTRSELEERKKRHFFLKWRSQVDFLQINTVQFSPEGEKILFSSLGEGIGLLNAKTGALLQRLEGHENTVTSACFSLDGRKIVSTSYDKTVKLWDASTGSLIRSFRGHESYVLSAKFSPDGREIISAASDHTVRLWNVESGGLVRTLRAESDEPVRSVSFFQNGNQIALSTWGSQMIVWNKKEGYSSQEDFGEPHLPSSARQWEEGNFDSVPAFLPEGSNGSISKERDLDQAGDALNSILEGHKKRINSLQYSPCGLRLVSSSDDGGVRVWDTRSGALLQIRQSSGRRALSASFSSDGNQIVCGFNDGVIQVLSRRDIECENLRPRKAKRQKIQATSHLE